MVRSFAATGHTVECCVAQQATEVNIPQHMILNEPLLYVANYVQNRRTAKKIIQVCQTFNPDIIHFFVEPYANTISFFPEAYSKISIFITGHGTYSYVPETRSGLQRMVARHLYDRALQKTDSMICVSSYTKKHLLRCAHRVLPAEKIAVITNGTGIKPILGNGPKQKNSIFNILFVGAIKDRKGIQEALRGLSEFRKTYNQPFIYHIVGTFESESTYFLKLQSTISEQQLEDSVVFHGKVSEEELQKFYASADVYLMTPISSGVAFEGFGLVYIEANAYGVPCIGSRDSGASEAILDQKTGYLVNSGEPQEIARALFSISKGRIEPEACKAWAAQNSIQRKTLEIIQLYEHVNQTKKLGL